MFNPFTPFDWLECNMFFLYITNRMNYVINTTELLITHSAILYMTTVLS